MITSTSVPAISKHTTSPFTSFLFLHFISLPEVAIPYRLMLCNCLFLIGISFSSFAQAQFKLNPSDGAAADNFGNSVAIDGNTAIIGAPRTAINGNNDQGAVYIYTFNGSTWNEKAKLTSSDGAALDNFGFSVAIDGNTIVVGAYLAEVNGTNAQGAAYIFTYNGSSWQETAKIAASDGADGDLFGYSVAIDANNVVIGAYQSDVEEISNQGAAYIFTYNGSSWQETKKLTASDGAAGDEFGRSVAIDENTILVGARFADISGRSNQGASYIYSLVRDSWTQTEKITVSNGQINDEFGTSVAINSSSVIVGAPRAVGENGNQGAAYIYNVQGGIWTQIKKLTAADGEVNDEFGNSVALAGNIAVVGVELDNASILSPNEGSAYVYLLSEGIWSQQSKLTASDRAEGDFFGNSVALSSNRVIVGAREDDANGYTNRGSAYVYELALPQPANNPPVLNLIGNKSAIIQNLVNFTATASDPDHGQTLTYSLVGAPAGATINPTTGEFTFTPTSAQPYTFIVQVIDNGIPAAFDQESITISVSEPPKQDQYIIFSKPADKGVGETFTLVAQAVPSGLPVTFFISGPVSQSGINGQTITTTGVGEVLVVATQAGNSQFNAAPVITHSFMVNNSIKQPQTISFNTISSKTFGNAPFAISAQASSILPVSFSLVDGPATVSPSGLVTLLGAGTITVRASQSGDILYAAAPHVDQTFAVFRSPQEIIFNQPPDQLHANKSFQLTAAATSYLPVSFQHISGPATVSSSGFVTFSKSFSGNESQVIVRAEQVGNTNYLPAAGVERTFIIRKSIKSKARESAEEDLAAKAGGVEFILFPVPASQSAFLHLLPAVSEKVTILLYDVRGHAVEVLYEGQVQANKLFKYTINSGKLASGMYIVRVAGKTVQHQQKLLISR